MKTTKWLLMSLAMMAFLATACDDDDTPEAENEEEFIDKITLTFVPVGGGQTVVATATDPDGMGSDDFVIEDIQLDTATTYVLAIQIENTVEGEDITEEIEDEDDEHMFFFGWTGDLFADPSGNGNIDNRTDAVNYNDEDEDGNPVGLETTWTTGGPASGTFRVVLKHQPGVKSATSTSSDGETDIELTFDLEVAN